MSNTEVVFDASGSILGRLASVVAKRLLEGEKVVVVNAERAVVSGGRASALEEAKKRLEVKTKGSLKKAPKHPRKPDGIVRRAVRGMLPWKKARGKEAYRRLMVYMGVPDDYKGAVLQRIPEAGSAKVRGPLVTIEEIAKGVGWTPPGEK